jgi:hypothetical protein
VVVVEEEEEEEEEVEDKYDVPPRIARSVAGASSVDRAKHP